MKYLSLYEKFMKELEYKKQNIISEIKEIAEKIIKENYNKHKITKEEVRKYVITNDFTLEKERSTDSKIFIRTGSPSHSYWKSWWKNDPQIVEWTITDLGDGGTRVETGFRLKSEFRKWFWNIFSQRIMTKISYCLIIVCN